MSWTLSSVEHLRMEFVMLVTEVGVNLSEACRQFRISRKTGYKWRRRYETEGLSGLVSRHRRPRRSPLMVSGDITLAIIRLRRDHKSWGPKKLRARLLAKGFRPNELPSVATVARVLKRAGEVPPNRRGRHKSQLQAGPWPLSNAPGPNDVWTVDLKGWWRTQDGKRCEPLGIRDLYSRYILCLRPVKRVETEALKTIFEGVFERYGLPAVIRSDNGGPFASPYAPHDLTRLSAWWRSLGIRHERIEPGHPQQNGSHERMHRDLAAEIARHPATTLAEETRRLEAWRLEYNLERPHEALGLKTPATIYRSSRRRLNMVVPYDYPAGFERHRVRNNGSVRLTGRKDVRISNALAGQEVGLERLSDTGWRVWFCDLLIKTYTPEPATQPQSLPALPWKPSSSCNPCPDNKVLPMSCS
jgi:putative transposase